MLISTGGSYHYTNFQKYRKAAVNQVSFKIGGPTYFQPDVHRIYVIYVVGHYHNNLPRISDFFHSFVNKALPFAHRLTTNYFINFQADKRRGVKVCRIFPCFLQRCRLMLQSMLRPHARSLLLSGACVSARLSHDVVMRAPPSARGFCKGSRCAAAVKQESSPHPQRQAHLLSLHPDNHQQVRMNPGVTHTTTSHTLRTLPTVD